MLFGIDVVIIEPGTVNTAMYDKGEKEDLSGFKQIEYWEAVQNFQKFIVTEARTNGLSPERLGEAVHVALSTAKPMARYAVIPQRFKNWTLPRLLPARMLDAELAKQMKLTRLRGRSQSLLQLRPVILNPAPNGCVIDIATALLQQLLNIAQRQRIAKIPPDRTKYETGCGPRTARTRKRGSWQNQNRSARLGYNPAQITGSPRFCQASVV